MPKPKLGNTEPSPAMQRIIAWLHGGRTPVDPVRAEWDTTTYEESGRVFAYRNFKLNRYEYAYGRIPAERLSDYEPQTEEAVGE